MLTCQRTLSQLDDLPRAARRLSSGETGSLSVATSPSTARHFVPPFIERFIRESPEVTLRLRQGFEHEVAEWLQCGEVDLAVSAMRGSDAVNVAYFPLTRIHRVILTPADHPLLRVRRPTLGDVARWPIITYDPKRDRSLRFVSLVSRNVLTRLAAERRS